VLNRVLVAAGATCLILAAPATAARVGWNEAAKAKGATVMVYKVDTLTFDSMGWRAHVTVRNVSHVPIGMRRDFGVALYADAKTQTISEGLGFTGATSYSSKLPASLEPGASWTGTIGGSGRLSPDRTIYDHALPILKGSGGSTAPSGPVI
jgi:hypothetical protein